MGRRRSPWSRPKNDPPPTERQLEAARAEAPSIGVTMSVGDVTGLRANIIGGLNARLAMDQFVTVEFVRIDAKTQAQYIAEIERGTASTCVYRRGDSATFFRKHPNRRYPAPTPRPRRE